MKRILILLLIFGWIYGQSALGRVDGQLKMQNDVIDNLNVDSGYDYSVKGTFTLGTSADTSLFVFDNSASTIVDLKWDIKGLVATTVLITENGAFVRSPDAVTPVNLDGNSALTTGMDSVYVVYEDSTLASYYGTTLFNISFGALQNTEGRMILKNDSLTVFKITTDANTNKVHYNFEWNEK